MLGVIVDQLPAISQLEVGELEARSDGAAYERVAGAGKGGGTEPGPGRHHGLQRLPLVWI